MKKLYIQQKVFKITDHYPVIDENQTPIYYVDEEFHFFEKTHHVSDATGNHIFTIKKEVFTLLPNFNIEFHDGNVIHLESKFTFFGKHIEVLPLSYDIRIEGEVFCFNFNIIQGNTVIGKIHRAFLNFGDAFEIEIFDEKYQAMIVAIMIAVDNIIDQAQKR